MWRSDIEAAQRTPTPWLRYCARAASPRSRMRPTSERVPAPTSSWAKPPTHSAAWISLSLAPELGPRNITVNSVAPGWVDTEMCAEPFANGGRERIAAGIPLGRIAAPRDIAGPIVFLCSELARHITGEIINVNGGSVLCG